VSRTPSLLVLGLCCLVAGSTAAQRTPAATVSGAPPSSSVLDPIDTSGVLDLRSASITQSASHLVWRFATRGAFLVSGLAAQKHRTACLQIGPRGLPAKAVRLCLTGRRGAQALYRSPVVPGGPPARFVTAWVSRPDLKTAVVGFAYTGAALVPGSVSWSVSIVWLGGSGCTLVHLCHDRAPDTGTVLGRIDHYRVSSCVAAGPSVRFSGPTAGRMIALTFDDGPTTYTTQILAVLNSHGAHATFFDIGRQAAAGASAERAVLASGDMLGNHTWSHPLLTARNVRTSWSRRRPRSAPPPASRRVSCARRTARPRRRSYRMRGRLAC
jgi:Polysaccharide deacetylase